VNDEPSEPSRIFDMTHKAASKPFVVLTVDCFVKPDGAVKTSADEKLSDVVPTAIMTTSPAAAPAGLSIESDVPLELL
jgi:hypothetical protein